MNWQTLPEVVSVDPGLLMGGGGGGSAGVELVHQLW